LEPVVKHIKNDELYSELEQQVEKAWEVAILKRIEETVNEMKLIFQN
jgi:hypothetical protein